MADSIAVMSSGRRVVAVTVMTDSRPLLVAVQWTSEFTSFFFNLNYVSNV